MLDAAQENVAKDNSVTSQMWFDNEGGPLLYHADQFSSRFAFVRYRLSRTGSGSSRP